MSLHQMMSRLEEVESTISSLFEGQFHEIDANTTDVVTRPLDQVDSRNIRVWLNMLRSDCTREVIEALVAALVPSRSAHPGIVSKLSRLSSRLEALAASLEAAASTWDHIYVSRREAALLRGGLNREELIRHLHDSARARDALLQQVVASRLYLAEVSALVADSEGENHSGGFIRCPITGRTCDKHILPNMHEVFVGYQFSSGHYSTASLKTMISEALNTQGLTPFFPDEHYEPVHISCEICQRLQQVSVCVFEISDSNPNVMFELGLAYMLGKFVMLLAKHGSPGTQISDIAGLHRIQYGDLVECRDFIARCLGQSETIQAHLSVQG